MKLLFQQNALAALKEGNLTLFSDIVNEAISDVPSTAKLLPEDHCLNKTLPEEDGKCLLMCALEKGKHDYANLLLTSGVDPNR